MNEKELQALLTLPVGQRVTKLREDLNLSQTKFGAKLNTEQSYVSRIESGAQKLSLDFAKRIAELCNIDVKYLIDTNEDQIQNQKTSKKLIKRHEGYEDLNDLFARIPCMGQASAEPVTDQNSISYINTRDELSLPHDIYTIRVNGDSMERNDHKGLQNNDLVVVKTSYKKWSELVNELVVVRLTDEEHMIKRLVKIRGEYFLKSDNPSYPLIQLPEDAVLEGEILYFIRELN